MKELVIYLCNTCTFDLFKDEVQLRRLQIEVTKLVVGSAYCIVYVDKCNMKEDLFHKSQHLVTCLP